MGSEKLVPLKKFVANKTNFFILVSQLVYSKNNPYTKPF